MHVKYGAVAAIFCHEDISHRFLFPVGGEGDDPGPLMHHRAEHGANPQQAMPELPIA